MSYRTNNDNIFSVGTVVIAKSTPAVRLFIEKYYQRIYYCGVVGDPGNKQLAYFERELKVIDPSIL